MDMWQATFLGLKRLPRELSGFEIEAFFTFTAAERESIGARRQAPLNLGLALQIGFLRMSGRPLDSVNIVPPPLWRHLYEQLGVTAPDLASLKGMYRRHRTLFEQQDLACEILGFRSLTEAQRRALIRALREEVTHTSDRGRRRSHGVGCTTTSYWWRAIAICGPSLSQPDGKMIRRWRRRFMRMSVRSCSSAGSNRSSSHVRRR